LSDNVSQNLGSTGKDSSFVLKRMPVDSVEQSPGFKLRVKGEVDPMIRHFSPDFSREAEPDNAVEVPNPVPPQVGF